MQKITEKLTCSGCHACYNACPKNCITMEADDEGFLYPNIDQATCINCGRCKKVCPILREYIGHEKGQAYACINKSEDIRMQSSSGGIFTLIAEWVIDHEGVVFGAAFSDKLNVQHIEVDNKEDLYKLRGSKYLQSSIGDTYATAENHLKQGRKVLFSGTPCQISGLKSYLGKDYDNLLLADIICHGVPSPAVWIMYLKSLAVKLHTSISRRTSVKFRDKTEGWRNYHVTIDFNGQIYSETCGKNTYMKAFLRDLCLRPSCYNCRSKSLNRESDITLADFWGIERVIPDMFDNKGTSLVFVNSQKGQSVFDDISKYMEYKETDIDEAVKYNASAYQSCILPKKRDWFMENVNSENFDECVQKCIKRSLVTKVKIKFKTIIKRMCK